jgi:hypothetical protein
MADRIAYDQSRVALAVKLHCRGVGRGAGVGRPRGVGVALGVAVAVGVGVGEVD